MKPFGCRSIRAAEQLAHRLVHKTLRTLSRLSADLYWFSDVDIPAAVRYGRFRNVRQEGRDLRERLQHAFLSLFAAGYASVTVVGNDSILNERDLHAALEESRDVVGPSSDGGFYLLTLHAGSANIGLLGEERWNGGRPAFAGRAWMRLRMRHDFDSWQTVVAWHPDADLVSLLLAACVVRQDRQRAFIASSDSLRLPATSRRPPPLLRTSA